MTRPHCPGYGCNSLSQAPRSLGLVVLLSAGFFCWLTLRIPRALRTSAPNLGHTGQVVRKNLHSRFFRFSTSDNIWFDLLLDAFRLTAHPLTYRVELKLVLAACRRATREAISPPRAQRAQRKSTATLCVLCGETTHSDKLLVSLLERIHPGPRCRLLCAAAAPRLQREIQQSRTARFAFWMNIIQGGVLWHPSPNY